MLLCRVLLQIPRYHPESLDSLDSRQSLPSSSPLSNFLTDKLPREYLQVCDCLLLLDSPFS